MPPISATLPLPPSALDIVFPAIFPASTLSVPM
jgi:hypothetical protein